MSLQKANEIAGETKLNSQADAPKGNILVVDDVPDNLRFLSATLTRRGYEVRSAINGAMALIGARTTLPDLVLLDIMMPEIDGYKVCEQLKADPQTRDIPVIFLSALDEVVDKIKAFEVGGVDYITKPFQVEEVLARVENQLTIRKLQRQLQQKNRELERSNQDLEQSNQDLEQFAHVVSHDLQQPLQSIITSADLLALGCLSADDDEARQYIDFIKTSSFRMSQLIQDLLAYSRVGAAKERIEPVDCQMILERVMANLQAAIAEAGALITHDPLPTVIANGTLLGQLFQNLISNAIKFQRPNERPQIKISVEQRHQTTTSDDDTDTSTAAAPDLTLGIPNDDLHITPASGSGSEWLFGVCDNGIGMKPEQYDRIFQIFQRLHSSQKYPGTGIGLCTCKKIIERHGGQIWVESEFGVGTTFYFTLPIEEHRTLPGDDD